MPGEILHDLAHDAAQHVPLGDRHGLVGGKDLGKPEVTGGVGLDFDVMLAQQDQAVELVTPDQILQRDRQAGAPEDIMVGQVDHLVFRLDLPAQGRDPLVVVLEPVEDLGEMLDMNIHDVRSQLPGDGGLVEIEIVHPAKNVAHRSDGGVPQVPDRGVNLDDAVDLLVDGVFFDRTDHHLVFFKDAHLAKPRGELHQGHGPGVPQALVVPDRVIQLHVRLGRETDQRRVRRQVLKALVDKVIRAVCPFGNDQEIDVFITERPARGVGPVQRVDETGVKDVVLAAETGRDVLHVVFDLLAQPGIHAPVFEIAASQEPDLKFLVDMGFTEQVSARAAFRDFK